MDRNKEDRAVNSLPSEITEAILYFLPAKSLGRFKLVSKTWNSLISDPRFIKNHVRHNNQHHQTTKSVLVALLGSLYSISTNGFHLNLNTNAIPATAKELSFLSPPIRWKRVLGSCNGLVLAEDESNSIILMNPTTHELCNVPTSPFALPEGSFKVRYGFGYDSSTDDYKVILISFQDPLDPPEPIYNFVSIYSLRKKSWRKFPNFPYDYRTHYLRSGAFIHHNCHWLTCQSTILVFSLADEVFKEIKLPDSLEKPGLKRAVEIGGKLGVFFGDKDVYELWVMQEYGNGKSWTRVCSYKFLNPLGLVFPVDRRERDYKKVKIVVFNKNEGTFINVRIVRELSVETGFRHFATGRTFVESLESPESIVTAT